MPKTQDDNTYKVALKILWHNKMEENCHTIKGMGNGTDGEKV